MKHIGHNLAILLCGLLELALIVLLILSVIPATPLGIEVDETVEVSCSRLEDGQYLLQIGGRLINRADVTAQPQALRVTVSDGNTSEMLVLDLPELSPRVPYDIFAEVKAACAYDRVEGLQILTSEGAMSLSNANDGFFNFSTLLCAFLAVADALVLIHFIKQRYYLAEEERTGV